MADARLPSLQQPIDPPPQLSSLTSPQSSPPLLAAPQETARVSDQTLRPSGTPQQTSTPKYEGPPQEEPTTSPRRNGRLWQFMAYYAVGGVLVAWSAYSLVRYAIAITKYADDAQRWRYAVAFTALSACSFLIFSVAVLSKLAMQMRQLHLLQHVLLGLASLTLMVPALFNLAFVTSWRTRSPARSTLSLVGRCSWDADIVWSGRAGQCPNYGVSWGAWLTGAILRFLITLGFLIAMICLSWSLRNISTCRARSSPRARPRSHSTAMLVGDSTSQSPNKLRRKSRPSDPLSPDSASSIQDHRRTFSSSNNTHHQATITYIPNLLSRPPLTATTITSPSRGTPPTSYDLTPASSSPRRGSFESDHIRLDSVEGRLSPSDLSAYYSDVDDGGDLNRFAHNFRNLVERVSRETEDGSRLPSTSRPPNVRQNTPPSFSSSRRTPSPRSSVQSGDGDLQRDLLQAHRIMLLEQAMRAESYEHVLVLGGAVRRMSTIPSVADASDREPWTPTSGTSNYATPRELTRSPTTSTARSGRRNPMARHTVSPTPPLSLNGRHTPNGNGNGGGDRPPSSDSQSPPSDEQ